MGNQMVNVEYPMLDSSNASINVTPSQSPSKAASGLVELGSGGNMGVVGTTAAPLPAVVPIALSSHQPPSSHLTVAEVSPETAISDRPKVKPVSKKDGKNANRKLLAAAAAAAAAAAVTNSSQNQQQQQQQQHPVIAPNSSDQATTTTSTSDLNQEAVSKRMGVCAVRL